MDPLLHYLALQVTRTVVDSPEVARRREIARERDRDARALRRHRHHECVRKAVARVTARRWRRGRELAGRAG